MRTLPMAMLGLLCFDATLGMAANDNQCGRPITKTIWFEPQAEHRAPQDEATVLMVTSDNGKPALFIHTSWSARTRSSGWSDYHQASSVDLGRIWEPVPQDVPTPLNIKDSRLFEAPSNPGFLYRYVPELGLYLRSENGGLSWSVPKYTVDGESREQIASRLTGTTTETVRFDMVAVHPSSPLTIFASLTVAPWTSITLYYPDFKHPEMGVVRELENTYISHDGGDTWERLTSELRPGEPIGISASHSNVFYAHGRRGMIKSVDAGANWEPVGQQRELELRPFTSADKDEQTRLLKGLVDLRIRQILVDPANENIVHLVSNKGLIQSLDGGATWRLLDLGFDEVDSARSIGLNPARTQELYIGTTRGVFFSSDRGCHFSKIYPTTERASGMN